MADGYYFNWMIFWRTAVKDYNKIEKDSLNEKSENNKQEVSLSLRDSKDYKSAVTSLSHITRQNSKIGRLDNLQFLANKVFSKINMNISDKTI